MATLGFYGAAGTVTGSKFLLEHKGFRMLIDAGFFQGPRSIRERNWQPPPFDPKSLDLIVLTHAHLDHTGYLPVLDKAGFEGTVLATEPTIDLCGVLLPDSGHIQEEDARWANKRGYSKHKPALPLYTEQDARRTLRLFRGVPFDKTIDVHDDISIRFFPAGHILGASFILVRIKEGSGERRIVFGGDLGRCARPIIPDPAPMPECDHLLVESTYGLRDHAETDPASQLASVVVETAERGGSVVIPAFAVGRTQSVMFMLRDLQREGQIPTDIPIYVDSPMAIHAIRVFMRHDSAYDLRMRALVAKGEDPLGLNNVRLCPSVEDSKSINDVNYPSIIISASGMATAGRVLHHLRYRLPDHRTTVLFAGYQAMGTRGQKLQQGAETVRIHGQEVPVRARIETLDGLSAHADRNGIVRWLQTGNQPKSVHLVHGEPDARSMMGKIIHEKLGYRCHEPAYLERVELE